MTALRDILLKAVSLHQGGDLPAAEILYRRILAQSPSDPDALHLYGVLKRREEGTAAGLRLFRRALAVAPDLADARVNLANTLVMAEDVPGALAEFEEALRRRPDDVLALRYMLTVLLANSRFREALPLAERFAALAPNDPESRRLLRIVYVGRPGINITYDTLKQGVTYEAEGRSLDAETVYRHALRMDPTHGDALNLLAQLAARTGRRPLAEYLLERARTLHPTRSFSLPAA